MLVKLCDPGEGPDAERSKTIEDGGSGTERKISAEWGIERKGAPLCGISSHAPVRLYYNWRVHARPAAVCEPPARGQDRREPSGLGLPRHPNIQFCGRNPLILANRFIL